MITRTAIFEGRVKPGCEEQFFTAITERLAPLWHQFQAVERHIWNHSPPIAMIQQVDYPSMAALEEAMGSPIRAQARAITMELVELFEGRFYHVVSEYTPVGTGTQT